MTPTSVDYMISVGNNWEVRVDSSKADLDTELILYSFELEFWSSVTKIIWEAVNIKVEFISKT